MNPGSYAQLAELLLKRIGLVLGDGKEYLLTTRLTPIVEEQGFGTLDALIAALARPANRALVEQVVDAMTTNETSFFRDSRPFETLFNEVLPRLIERRAMTRKLSIWNAGCSTGQEPYSVVMGLSERHPELMSWNLQVTATDVSRTVIDRAQTGRYNHFEVQRGLPVQYLIKYFEQDEREYQLKHEIRRRVNFKALNLMEPFNSVGEHDIIFVRNVLIYFDPEVKRDILERMCNCLAPDGVLFLGSTESMIGITKTMERVTECSTVVFRRADASPEIEFV